MNLAITGLMHKLRHFADEGKQIERLAGQCDQSTIDLPDVAQLADDRDEART